MSVAVIIAAGGRGLRLGGSVPKQLLHVGGSSLLSRSVAAFAAVPRVTEFVVVAPLDHLAGVETSLPAVHGRRPVVVAGGGRRQESVANGLRATSQAARIVLVHDAARPFVSADLISKTIEAAERHGAAIAALPVTDTVKRARLTAEGPFIQATLPREEMFLAQTPQAFRRDVLEEAVRLGESGVEATDEAALAELAGYAVHLVSGEATNIKITTAADLRLATFLAGQGAGAVGRNAVHGGNQALEHPVNGVRIGTGYDSHRLVEGRPLVLGGVRIPYEKGLLGHSDADVVAHAVTDAVLGAAALGDIGRWFPDTDPQWKDVDSLHLLNVSAARLRDEGFAIANVDVTIIAERPKLLPHVESMRANIAAALTVAVDRVSIKAKTNEGLDATGRGEAIVAHAVALIVGS